jgi:hypothetical protein
MPHLPMFLWCGQTGWFPTINPMLMLLPQHTEGSWVCGDEAAAPGANLGCLIAIIVIIVVVLLLLLLLFVVNFPSKTQQLGSWDMQQHMF